MALPERKGPAVAPSRAERFPVPVERTTAPESRESRPIRLKPSEVEELKREASARGIGWTTFARECLLTGLSVEQARSFRESHTRITA